MKTADELLEKKVEADTAAANAEVGGDGGAVVDEKKEECGPCYGAKDGCCNTCEEVRDAYRKKGWAVGSLNTIEQCVKEGFINNLDSQSGEGCNMYVVVVLVFVYYFLDFSYFSHCASCDSYFLLSYIDMVSLK